MYLGGNVTHCGTWAQGCNQSSQQLEITGPPTPTEFWVQAALTADRTVVRYFVGKRCQ